MSEKFMERLELAVDTYGYEEVLQMLHTLKPKPNREGFSPELIELSHFIEVANSEEFIEWNPIDPEVAKGKFKKVSDQIRIKWASFGAVNAAQGLEKLGLKTTKDNPIRLTTPYREEIDYLLINGKPTKPKPKEKPLEDFTESSNLREKEKPNPKPKEKARTKQVTYANLETIDLVAEIEMKHLKEAVDNQDFSKLAIKILILMQEQEYYPRNPVELYVFRILAHPSKHLGNKRNSVSLKRLRKLNRDDSDDTMKEFGNEFYSLAQEYFDHYKLGKLNKLREFIELPEEATVTKEVSDDKDKEDTLVNYLYSMDFDVDELITHTQFKHNI
jgi:hypothetical protein